MRRLAVAELWLLLPGCIVQRDVSRAWLLYVRDVPVARVTLAGASTGNEVNVTVRGGTAEVTLRHNGRAMLDPLDEPAGLKVALHQFDIRALAQGRFADVERELNATPSSSRDDLALSLLKATSDAELSRVAEQESGRRVLKRLCHELTSGSVWDTEREQSQRLLRLWAERIGPEQFIRAIEGQRTKVFPVRKSGPTVMDPVSPEVRLGSSGLDVSFSTKIVRYHQEWPTLGGMHLQVADDEVVGVKLYDEGGVIRFVPALFLVEVSNAEARHTLQKCGEMFALGLTLGSGAVAGTSGRAASALLWCDRTAVTIGVLLSVVDDHRGEILERFGDRGERFLRYADGLASLVALYGLGRVVVAVPRAVIGLRRAYLDLKAAKAALNAEEKALLDRIGRGMDELAEKAGKGAEVIPIERGRKPDPVPATAEEPLRATGTEIRLVPLGDGTAVPPVVASPGPPLKISSRQLGKKFGEHRDPNRPGYRTPDEYRRLAEEVYTDPRSKKTTFSPEAPKYPRETHFELDGNLLRVEPSGEFRSLYPTE